MDASSGDAVLYNVRPKRKSVGWFIDECYFYLSKPDSQTKDGIAQTVINFETST